MRTSTLMAFGMVLVVASVAFSQAPVAMRVEVEPFAEAADGTGVEVVIQVSPEDRRRVGEHAMVRIELDGEAPPGQSPLWAVSFDDDGMAVIDTIWPVGEHRLVVNLESPDRRQTGLWVGTVRVPSFAGGGPEPSPSPALTPTPTAVMPTPTPTPSAISSTPTPTAMVPTTTPTALAPTPTATMAAPAPTPTAVPPPVASPTPAAPAIPPPTSEVSGGAELSTAPVSDPPPADLPAGDSGESASAAAAVAGAAAAASAAAEAPEALPEPTGDEAASSAEAEPAADPSAASEPPAVVADAEKAPEPSEIQSEDEAALDAGAAPIVEPLRAAAPEETVDPVIEAAGEPGPSAAEIAADLATWSETDSSTRDLTVFATRQRQAVVGLGPNDLRVRLARNEVPVVAVGDGAGAPLLLGLAVDLSPQRAAEWPQIARGLEPLAERASDGRGALFVASGAEVGPWQEDPDPLEQAMEPANGGDLVGLVSRALDRFDGRLGRSALIVLTDGTSEPSKAEWQQISGEVEKAGVPVLVAVMWDRSFSQRLRKQLTELATNSGGRSFLVQGADQMVSVVERFGPLLDGALALRLDAEAFTSDRPQPLSVEAIDPSIDITAPKTIR